MITSPTNAVRLLLVIVVMAGCEPTGEIDQSEADSEAEASKTAASAHAATVPLPATDWQERCFCESPPLQTDWPQLFGLYGNSSTCESDLLLDWGHAGPPILWQMQTGTGYSAPVVQGSLVVLLHRVADREIVSCLNVETGDLVWEREDPTQFKCDYAAYSDGPYSTPTIHGDLVLVQSAEGVMRCLAMQDGTLLWSRNLSREYEVPRFGYGVGHSPVVFDDTVVVNVGGAAPDSGVVALDLMTGTTVWTGLDLSESRRTGSHATPVLANIGGLDACIILSGDRVSSLDANTGALLWEFPVTTNSRDTPNATTPLVMNNQLLVSSFRADTFCISVTEQGEAKIAWRKPRSLGSVFNPLTCRGDYVLGWHSFDKSLRAVSVESGAVLWKKKTVFERGNHIDTGDDLIVLGEMGHLGVVTCNADRAEVRCATAEPFLKGPCFTMPALSGGRLLIRDEQQLICCDLRPQARRVDEVERQ